MERKQNNYGSKMDKTVFVNQLEKAFARIGISSHGKKVQIAELMGVTRAAVGKWFDKTEVTLPKHDLLIKISEITGMSIDALLKGDAFDEKSYGQIPILTEGQIINIDKLSEADKFEYAMPALLNLKDAFAWRVTDDSMRGQHQAYPAGCYAIFERNEIASNNDLVFARIGGTGVFRKFVAASDKEYLMPLNPTYENDTKFEILAIYKYAVFDFETQKKPRS